MIRTEKGIWLRLDRHFTSSDRAYRAAQRTRLRSRIVTPQPLIAAQ